MSPGSLIRLLLRYRPWEAAHRRLIFADVRGKQGSIGSDREHLEALISWLCHAQDQRDGCADAGSVSAGWSFEDGWLPGYPETSGYIVETFLGAADVLERPDLRRRAERILDWELSIQNPDGSFPGHFGEAGSEPVIFNTGQIMHGMMAGYLELGREECLEAAVRAGAWMRQRQDADGCWRRSVHNGIPHTYNSRAAWALLRTARAANDKDLETAAVSNLRWVVQQQRPCGWFAQNGFLSHRPPFTHNIAYAIRGLLESALILEDDDLADAARHAAHKLAQQQRSDGWLAGAFGENWQTRSYYCCQTGLAQSALIWKRLEELDPDPLWGLAADRAIVFLKHTHRRDTDGAPHAGGVAGSYPIWGRYSMFEYPNWAAKFFADLLLVNGSARWVPMMPERSETAREAVAV